jgi:hypothetical protein
MAPFSYCQQTKLPAIKTLVVHKHPDSMDSGIDHGLENFIIQLGNLLTLLALPSTCIKAQVAESVSGGQYKVQFLSHRPASHQQ